MGDVTSQDILSFWYAEETRPFWFQSTPAFDATIRTRFADAYAQAQAGELDHWTDTPEGALALIIVLDQFPRNLFRKSPDAFATDAKAVRIATQAVESGVDQHLPKEQQHFLYMPFMHSENLADQERCIALFTAAGLDKMLSYAIEHRDTIAQFGRFPYRNEALGRTTTAEEEAYLARRKAA